MAQSALDMSLERSSDVPLGTQLAWKLRAAIAAGALRPGDRLPAVRELATAAGVNVNTVRSVYARLSAQGVIVSEQGRGTFVGEAGRARPDLGELVARAARDARLHDVDPRELAAVLYAHFERGPTPLGEPADEATAPARRALRVEIEALEHELAALEPTFAGAEAEGTGTHPGARLVSARELEATRDRLAARVAERRRQQREARSRARAPEPPVPQRRPSSSAWPELLAGGPPLIRSRPA
jgi:GntR family transcriptional regulator